MDTNRTALEKSGAAGWGWGVAWAAIVVVLGAWELGMAGNQHVFWSPWDLGTAATAAGVALAIAALVWGLGRAGKGAWVAWLLAAGLVAAQWTWGVSAWRTLREVPWGFDHPSFMFRLWEFGKVFPGALGGYMPWWNGGIEHFVGVTSGAHAFGVLTWPLLQIWDPHVFYGAALLAWFVVVAPWLTVLSARWAGAGWPGALVAGWASAGVSQEFFLWMWHFGTVGAMTSATLVGPVAFLAWRLANGRGGWATAALLGVAGWVACLWTPGAFAVAGIGAGWLLNWELWTKEKWAKFAAAAGLGAVLWAPWLWTTMFPCRNVVEYVGTDGETGKCWGEILRNGGLSLWRRIPAANPAVLALGVGGLLAGTPKGLRKLVWPAVVVLLALAGWSRELKPLSQMMRMWIPALTLLCVPTAWVADGLFVRAGQHEAGVRGGEWRRVVACLACGIVAVGLGLGARAAWSFYRNARPAKMRTYVPGSLEPLAEWIRENVPEDGRLAWAGKSVHAYGGGNTAYWPVLTGREMMGDDYYGFPERTIEYDYPPRAYRELGEEGWRAFGEAYGVTHWIAGRPEDAERLRSMPGLAEEVANFRLTLGRVEVCLFKVRGATGGRFLKGRGRVEADENLLRVRVEETGEDGRAIIRYNWRTGLTCLTHGAQIAPAEVDEHLRFIAVVPGTNEWVEIGYKPHWSGVEPNFDGRFHH